MTVPKKILVCFLLSVFLFAGIAALAFTGFLDFYGGIVNEPAGIPMLVAVFLTLFLIIFFCFNLRQNPAKETQPPAGSGERKPVIRKYVREAPPLNDREYEELEELEAVVEESYLAEFSGADTMPEGMITADTMSGKIVLVETVGGLGGGISLLKPFTFSQGNPELLQEAESQEDEVFYEQDGIHYINSKAFTHDTMEKLDSDFAKLVESVVNKD